MKCHVLLLYGNYFIAQLLLLVRRGHDIHLWIRSQFHFVCMSKVLCLLSSITSSSSSLLLATCQYIAWIQNISTIKGNASLVWVRAKKKTIWLTASNAIRILPMSSTLSRFALKKLGVYLNRTAYFRTHVPACIIDFSTYRDGCWRSARLGVKPKREKKHTLPSTLYMQYVCR